MANFGSLSIGISGLYANRMGLETVSHNIANADNSEYVRQRVNYSDSPLRKAGQLKVGTGTDVQGIKQIRDEFLDQKLRGQVSTYGYWGEKYNISNQVDSILNETGEIDDKVTGGLAKTMDGFWKSMAELSKTPENLTVRGVFKERAEGFATTVRHMYDQLDTLQKNLNTSVKSIVDETNRISTQLADLNKEIVSREASGISANDYRDKRNGLIDRLSQIAEISVSEDSKGYVNVAIAGTHIVLENSAKQLEYRENPDGPRVDVYWEGETEKISLDKELKSGELKAVLEARGSEGDITPTDKDGFKNLIPAMKEKLNDLVKTVAVAINEQQEKGFTLDSTAATPKSGQPIFVIEGGGVIVDYKLDALGDPILDINGNKIIEKIYINASNIKLNINSLNDIAASASQDEYGNSKNMEDMLKLRDKLLYSGGKFNIDDFYRDVISDFGTSAQESRNMMEAHGRIIVELDNKKQSVSAVSLDEEMSNMLKFQHGYSASTRFINAIDEMLDVIINRMGK